MRSCSGGLLLDSRLINSLLKLRPGMSPRFLMSEYGAKRAQEENTFDSGECNHAFGKAGIGGVAPFESPVGFTLYAWYCFDCV